MKQSEPLEVYNIILTEHPRLTTLKAKYNACAIKLNKNKMNRGILSDAQEEELYEKLHVIKQLILAHED